MGNKIIDKTQAYVFERIVFPSNNFYSGNLTSLFLHQGEAVLEYLEGGNSKTSKLFEGNGFIVNPTTPWRIASGRNIVAYKVSSKYDPKKQPYVVLDEDNVQTKFPLESLLLVSSPKKVNKPWGHELWVSWTNYHVLKQIGMNAGNQSSLQFHREKLETNYLESGEAAVIDGYRIDPQSSEERIQKVSSEINFKDYKKKITPGMHWTSVPGTIHRVIAEKDYLAYEVSTPELDDVIRLQDDSGRKSGRINSEHLKK